jgi:hypothetical protein
MGLVTRPTFLVICGYNLSQNWHPRIRSPETDYNELYKQSAGFTIKALFIIEIIRFFVFVEQLRGCGDVRGWLRDTKVEVFMQL